MFPMALIVSEWPASTGFDPIKARQVIAYFARKNGGSIEKLKLTKLIYLSERLSFQKRSAPMNFDDFYSMPHGPVPSSSLNVINAKADGIKLHGNLVSASDEIGNDRLSANDVAILDQVWGEFGKMSAFQLRNWTHDNCKEYVEVPEGRFTISYDEILDAVAVEDSDAIMRELKFLQREMGRLPGPNGA